MNKNKWDFTKELLNNTKINQWAVLNWAIWSTVCWTFNRTKDKTKQRELIHKIVDHEIDKWIK
jgi:hypothetical protein